jgi:hypothetical protein
MATKGKMIDVEIFDRVASIDSQLAKSRLHYSFIPGVEANFVNRSLIYDYDGNVHSFACSLTYLLISLRDECEVPLQLISSRKGKEKDAPTLKVGLKWTGRQAQVQKAGLPTSPPEKMFRLDYAGIPMSPEERVTLRQAGP